MIHFKHNISLAPQKKGNIIYVRARISICGQRREVNLGISVPEECYKDGKIIKHPASALYNSQIQGALGRMSDIISDYELVQERVPSLDEFLERYNGNLEVKPTSIFDAFDNFILTESNLKTWSIGTCKKFRTMRTLLYEFSPKTTFNDITETYLQRLTMYCINVKGYKNCTTHRYIANIKWFLSWAKKKKLYKGDAHLTFEMRLKDSHSEGKEIIFLTMQELAQLENLYLSEEHTGLARLRDVFLFCCYSGLRYSDANALTKAQIEDGVIHLVTTKTNDELRIELNDKSKAILDKYSTTISCKALPVISNQKSNIYLKTLCKMAGIDKPTKTVSWQGKCRVETIRPKYELVTFHSARKTFITTALTLGISSEVIMKWTGHKDFAAMKPYMKIVDELKAKEMAKFNTLFFPQISPISPKFPPKSELQTNAK